MATGDITYFDQYLVDIHNSIHTHNADDFKMALVTNAWTADATVPDPRWGSGGGTDLSTYEAAVGGNYPANGLSILNPTVTLSGGVAYWDGDDISIAQDPGNPQDGFTGIIYNNGEVGVRAIGFVELGAAPIDMQAGPFSVQWHANGIHQMSKP